MALHPLSVITACVLLYRKRFANCDAKETLCDFHPIKNIAFADAKRRFSSSCKIRRCKINSKTFLHILPRGWQITSNFLKDTTADRGSVLLPTLEARGHTMRVPGNNPGQKITCANRGFGEAEHKC